MKFSVVLSPTYIARDTFIQDLISLWNSRSTLWYIMVPGLGSKILQASPISVKEFYDVLVPLWTGIISKTNVQAPAPKRPKFGISCPFPSISKPLRICRHRCQWGRRLYGFGCSLCCSQNIPARQAHLRFSIFPYCH